MKKILVMLLCLTALSAARATLLNIRGEKIDTSRTPTQEEQKDRTPSEPVKKQTATPERTRQAAVASPAATRSNRLAIGIGAASAATLLTALTTLLLRIRRERKNDTTQPESWDEIRTIARRTLQRFGKQAFGHHALNAKTQHGLLESSCGRQWMITSRKKELVGSHAWLVTINHTCTHFEVHHNEGRLNSIRSEDLSGRALSAALDEARAAGPFKMTYPPRGEWNDISLR